VRRETDGCLRQIPAPSQARGPGPAHGNRGDVTAVCSSNQEILMLPGREISLPGGAEVLTLLRAFSLSPRSPNGERTDPTATGERPAKFGKLRKILPS
jgi:hypothetical protein